MQITETVTEGLHREFLIKVGVADLDAKLIGKITEMQPRVHLKGFRPGKAPVSFLKKAYGKSLMSEIVEQTLNEGSEQALKERALKPAITPSVDLVNDIESVVAGKADLEFTMKVDLMPEFELAKLEDLKVERLTAEVPDSEVDEAISRLADSQKTYEPKEEGAAAESGDAVSIDFLGKLDGEPFEGGAAEDFDLTLGSGSFIPGFEDQLIGVKAGEQRIITVSFPENYGAQHLAGKESTFDVTVKAVKAAQPVTVDDEFAKKLGLDSLDVLKERVREQLAGEYSRASRLHLKRRLLDALDAANRFELPPVMVESEFQSIWQAAQAEMQRGGTMPADEGKTEEELKAEYREIAERRVRLGLVLAKIGAENAISVTQDELNRAITAQARRYPGQEQQVFQYYSRNPNAAVELQAPLFEEKVVDFISELAQVTDRPVDHQILLLDPDEAEEKLNAGTAGAEAKENDAKPKRASKPKAKKDEE
jgi:trigger factor